MEITYQFSRKDTTSRYEYFLQNTKQGRAYSKQTFWSLQMWIILMSLFLGALSWAIFSSRGTGLVIFSTALTYFELTILISTAFHPRYGYALDTLKKQDRKCPPAAIEESLLPRTLKFGESTFEIFTSNALHRYRFETIEKITVGEEFIFIELKTCDIFQVPKRSFPAEEKYLEFGNALISAWQKNKDKVEEK